MQTLPTWLVAALNDPFQLIPRIEWSPDWTTWFPLQPLSGSHAQDRTQQNRWQFSGSFVKDYAVSEQGINPYGPRVRIFLGVKTIRNPTYWFPQGVYSIVSADEDENSIQLSGSSFETDVSQADFLKTRRIPDRRGETYRVQAETLIREAVPDARFYWDARLNYNDTCPVAYFTTGRWTVVDGTDDDVSIMGALGGEAYCDAAGGFHFVPVPTLDDAPVWRVAKGGALVGQTRGYDRDEVFNIVSASGDSTDGSSTAGPMFAWDADPDSITFAGVDPVNQPGVGAARFGVKPFAYTNSLIKDNIAAANAAAAQLANKLGLHYSVTLTSRFHPAVEAGDVIESETYDDRIERHLLDKVSYTWGAAEMQCEVRSPKNVYSAAYAARLNSQTKTGGEDGTASITGGTAGTVSFPALSGRSFTGTGTSRSTTVLYQGYFDAWWGSQKSTVFFDTVAMASALSGKTITAVTLKFRTQFATDKYGVTAVVGTHNSANTITAWPAGVRTNLVQAKNCLAGEWNTVQLPISAALALQAGTMKGITFGPGPDKRNVYYGYHYLSGTDAPILTFSYSS